MDKVLQTPLTDEEINEVLGMINETASDTESSIKDKIKEAKEYIRTAWATLTVCKRLLDDIMENLINLNRELECDVSEPVFDYEKTLIRHEDGAK